MRENSEGEYSGVGGRVHRGYPIETATDVSIMTRAGCERILIEAPPADDNWAAVRDRLRRAAA